MIKLFWNTHNQKKPSSEDKKIREKEEQDFKEELKSIRDANKHMESMKLWYENVMGFAQTIQGVTLDIEMAKINEPNSWKQAFGKDQINLKLIDDSVKHTLKLKFENIENLYKRKNLKTFKSWKV